MNDQTNIASVRPMRIGRALHMDITRASDEDLDRAFAALDGYLNETRVSAWTEDKFDLRIAEITDEQDRRAGVEPLYVEAKPIGFEAVADDDDERFAHADDEDEDEDDEDDTAGRRIEAYGEDADNRRPTPLERLRHHVTGAIERGEGEAITEQPFDPAEANRHDNGLTPEQEAEALAPLDDLRDTFAETGLVPGLHSSL